jgi:hypothetical protein
VELFPFDTATGTPAVPELVLLKLIEAGEFVDEDSLGPDAA